METIFWQTNRFLQDNGTAVEGNSTSSTTTSTNDAAILRATFVVYGSLLLGMFLLFCYVRRKFPRAYQTRNWVAAIQSPIAEDQHGFFSWMWQLNAITEDEIMAECGMDSVCVLRLLMMGYKVCILSALNAIWLMPLYSTGVPDGKNVDSVVSVTISEIPSGSNRLIGTAIATYMLFGYIMYLVLQEFEWFIEMRHKYLKRPVVENYAVYVRNIPPEYCNNTALYKYFAACFTETNVLEAKVRIKLPTLVNMVQKRDVLIKKLEHAINYKNVKKRAPTHYDMQLLRREKVDSISYYTKALHDANCDISQIIEDVECRIMAQTSDQNDEGHETISESVNEGILVDPLNTSSIPSTAFGTASISDDTSSRSIHIKKNDSSTRFTSIRESDEGAHNVLLNNAALQESDDSNKGSQSRVLSTRHVSAASRAVTSKTISLAQSASKSAFKMLSIREEGEFYNAGFVTFKCLGTTQAALQMVHHQTPFDIEVLEAPRPDDIFWSNVGRSHHDLQIGKLISLGSTVALCLLWTIPMTFIASLSSVEALSTQIPPLGDLIEQYPIIGKILEVLAPLLIKVVNGLLPTILEYLTKFEGPVSGSIIVASLFTKLAAFMIIQTFFVSAIGGSVLNGIEAVVERPESIVSILAKSLPSQSTYFIQIVFVSTSVSMGFEILRVMPLIFAFIRRFLPPNLTKEEQQTTVLGLFRPLADPDDFGHADSLAQITLNFIIMLVYATIAPLTVFIQGFCFLFMMVCYKHQFVYIYPNNSDSGGKIWTNFISVLLPCLLIAQFTILGLLAIKQSVFATPMMVPLIVVTILFNAYVRQQHFRVAAYLPSRECMKADVLNGPEFDLSFTKDAYLQEELREKMKRPTNWTDDLALN